MVARQWLGCCRGGCYACCAQSRSCRCFPDSGRAENDSRDMWFCARRQCTIPSVTVLVCILLGLLIFTKHLKELYDLNRKAQRFRRYTDFLEEVSDSMSRLEVNANKSYKILQILNNVIDNRYRMDRPNV